MQIVFHQQSLFVYHITHLILAEIVNFTDTSASAWVFQGEWVLLPLFCGTSIAQQMVSEYPEIPHWAIGVSMRIRIASVRIMNWELATRTSTVVNGARWNKIVLHLTIADEEWTFSLEDHSKHLKSPQLDPSRFWGLYDPFWFKAISLSLNTFKALWFVISRASEEVHQGLESTATGLKFMVALKRVL